MQLNLLLLCFGRNDQLKGRLWIKSAEKHGSRAGQTLAGGRFAVA
jgi:hypothetical protein